MLQSSQRFGSFWIFTFSSASSQYIFFSICSFLGPLALIESQIKKEAKCEHTFSVILIYLAQQISVEQELLWQTQHLRNLSERDAFHFFWTEPEEEGSKTRRILH